MASYISATNVNLTFAPKNRAPVNALNNFIQKGVGNPSIRAILSKALDALAKDRAAQWSPRRVARKEGEVAGLPDSQGPGRRRDPPRCPGRTS